MAGRRKTRRSTHVDNSSDREGAEQDQLEDGTDHPAEQSSPVLAPTQLPGDMDFSTLSTLLPGIDLQSPTNDAVLTIYRLVLDQHTQLETKDHELENVRADLEKKEIEADQLLQDHESNEKELESNLEKLQNELKQTKQERDDFSTPCFFLNFCSFTENI